MGRRGKPGWVKALAEKKVRRLLALAEKEFGEHPERSNAYAKLAKKTAVKYNVKIPQEYKKRICPACGAFLVPGKNLKVRTSPEKAKVIYICGECGETQETGYSREKLKKDKKD